MAYKVANATGNWGTAATWNSVTNTPTMHASTNISVAGTSYSATFTAPNTTNACTGVIVYVSTAPAGGYTYTLTLQENTSDTVAVVAVADSAFPASGAYIYFQFATPYVFTATTAGYYRFKLVRSGAGTTSLSAAADSAGTAFAYLATDNRTGVPGTTDDVWVVGTNGATAVTLTVDGTQTIGSGASTALVAKRAITNAINISSTGTLKWDTAASATLTCKGNICVYPGGELQAGTALSAYPTGKIATLHFDEGGTAVNYGLGVFNGGKLTLQGLPKSSTTLWKTTYVSGVGTAADPLIVADSVNWLVNDEIQVAGSAYGECETKYIKTVNSATSYVISNSKGGAEAAFSYVHVAGHDIINVERNVIIDSTSTSIAWYLYGNSQTAGNIDIDWARFETTGANTTNKSGVLLTTGTADVCNVDYSVFYRAIYVGLQFTNARTLTTYTGNIACLGGTASLAGFYYSNTANQICDYWVAINNGRYGFSPSVGADLTINNAISACNNTSGSSGAGGIAAGIMGLEMDNAKVYSNRVGGFIIQNSTAVVKDSAFSSLGTNTIDLIAASGSSADGSFINCTFAAATLLSGYTAASLSAIWRFDRFNGIADNHYWYTPFGIARSTKSTLTDTTVRTPGSMAVRIAPENATTGFTWEFSIPCKSNSIVSFFGWFYKNAAFGTDDAIIELWLPGSTSADSTYTLNDTTDAWQAATVAASYSGTVDTLATVKIIGKTTTASAYLYCDDFYNAGDTVTNSDKVTGLDTWYQGQPINIISPQAVSAADIWTFNTTLLTTQNTTGQYLRTIRNNAVLIPGRR